MLVPEATNVDAQTLKQLSMAKKEDYFLSNASPLGVPFNNFRPSSSETQRKTRIEKGRPGSPCYKKYLTFDTTFTSQPICTASREYQNLKIKQLQETHLPEHELKAAIEMIEEKDCLCEGLGAGVLLKNHLTPDHKLTAVNICPGPNLAYFSGIFSLEEMVGHIYGRINILNSLSRPHIFINELALYADYLKKEIQKQVPPFSVKQNKHFISFKENLLSGIQYYKNLIFDLKPETKFNTGIFHSALEIIEAELNAVMPPEPVLSD